MTATYVTAGICVWAIVCIFALAFNAGAHRKADHYARKHELEEVVKKQRGFTLIELLFAIASLASIGLACGLAYIGLHFIAKFW